MLPTFLGIGAPKAGTTWLYQLLDSHPDVQMSQHRKEVHYFDRHFESGPSWYEEYFPQRTGAEPLALGEFTTHYLYEPEVPQRIHTVPSIARFLLIVRNPVDRAFSHYRFRRRQDNLTSTFEEFLATEAAAVELGLYAKHLARWLEEYDRGQFLVLVYEEAFADVERTKAQIGEHLGIRPDRFPASVASANEAFVPRRQGLYSVAVKAGRSLRKLELDRVITLAKRTGVVDLVKKPKPAEKESLSDAVRAQLWGSFAADVDELEKLTGLDLDLWRTRRASTDGAARAADEAAFEA